MRAQVVELREHVLLDQRVDPGLLVQLRMVLADHDLGARGIVEPALDGRQALQLLGMQQRLHRAAVRMAADDDVLHVEGGDRVFDRRGDATIDVAVRRRDVAGVAADEQVARLGLNDQVGHDTRIRAGDQQRFRLLPRRERAKEVAVLLINLVLEAQRSIDQSLHTQHLFLLRLRRV